MQLFTGKQYLQIDIANNSGFDKLNYDERISKTLEMYPEDKVKYASNEELKELVRVNQADEPELTFAGLMAYRDVLNGIPTGYRVALDASSSGSQLMSALTRCTSGLYLTGMYGNKRMDLYTEVFKLFKEILGSDVEISRVHIKKAIMTGNYGSIAQPNRVLGKDNMWAYEKAMEELCEGAWELRQLLLDTWNPNVDSQDWIMPDGFHVVCPVMEKVEYTVEIGDEKYPFNVKEQKPSDFGLSNVANVVHSLDSYLVREMVRRVKYNKAHVEYVLYLLNQYNADHSADLKIAPLDTLPTFDLLMHYFEETNMLTVRIIDEIQSIADVARLSTAHRTALKEVLSKMIQYEPFDIAIIHDSFSAHPNNLNYVRYWYNHMVANVVDSNLLQCILDQISPEKIEIYNGAYTRKLIAKKVLDSDYGIC